MKVDTLTPVLVAAPGDRATCRLRIENDGAAAVAYRLRIVGFDDAHVLRPPPSGPLAAGASEDVALDFVIPEAFAAGHHSVAVEVVADRPGVAPAIAAVTVTVGTIEDVAMAVVPSTMRAHRRASFRLDIDNRSNRVVDLELDGAGPDLDVRLRPDRVVLRPGERVRTSGRVKGPRHLTGEPLQHSLTVTARSSSAPSYAPATFQQRPLLPKGLRSLVAILLIVGIWAGALGAGFLWWNNRNDEAEQAEVAELVDTDGDGVPDTPGDQLVDTDGDGTPDTLASVVAEEVAAAGEAGPPQAGGGDRPTRTVMGGSVKAADGGDPSGVAVTLIPRDLGAPPAADDAPAPAGLTGVAGQSRGVKLWPARFGRHQTVGQSAVRRTQTIQSTATGEDGAWLFSDVAVGQSYEVSFALAGYDTQSFIVTPSADGKPVQLAVDLKAAAGSVSGSVVGPRGPLANVDLVLTDGTLRFNSSSASGADQGSFSFPGVSTPGTYTLTANLRGFGTEVLQVTLAPGEQLDGLRIGMTAGVGSISGRVTENGEPLGGVRLTASNGDTTAETTSLTEGDRGSFTFPQLAIPGRYTVTASLEGYSTQTRLVVLDGNVSGVDFDFVKTTGAIIGTVASSTGIDLPGTNIRVSRDEIAFDTKSAVEPDPGSFTITDLPPGTYLVEFSRYDHAPYSQSVEIGAGQVVDLGRIVLEFRGRPTIPQNGSLEVRVINSLGDPLNGATVRVFDVSSGALVAEQSDAATPAAPDGTRSTFLFAPLDIGTYRIEVSKDDTYRVSTRRTSVGLQPKQEIIPLYRLGQASGRVIDSFTKAQLIDYDIQIFRINPDGSETFVQGIPVTADTPLTDTPDGPQIRWETAAASLTSGTYRVVVVNPPPGYRVVPDQELVAGLPDMQFVISPTDDTPLNLNDIEADRYPEVAGTVLAPQLSGTDVTFEQITAGGLTVELTCPGTDGEPESVLLNAPRPVLPPGSQAPDPGLEDTGGGAAYDSFFFDRVTLESNDLSGDCTLTVNADGYEPAVIPVLVSPGDGSSDPLVFRNVAMIRPDNVGGTTYWTDDGVTPPARRRDTAGVEVRSQGRVIVRFDPGITERTEPRSDPSVVPAGTALVQTTDATGGWAFIDPRQVFGSTNYVFGAPGRFADRIVTIELAEDGRTVTPGPGPGATLGIDATNPAIDVELDAAGGVITAQVQIATIKGTPSSPGVVNLDGFQVALTGANTATSAPTRFGANAGGVQQARATFSVLDPGTHQVEVTSTAVSGPRPLFDRVGPQPPAFLQSPGTNVTVPPVTFVERGAINVGVNDVAGNPIPGTTVNIVQASDGTNFPVTLTGSPATVVQAGLPVSTTIGALTPYNVSLAANDALDASTAQLSLFNENDALVRTCLLTTPGCGTVNIAQGGQPRVVIRVSRLGSITGTVLGDDGDTSFVPLVPPALTVVAQRVALENCVVLATPDAPRPVVAVGNDFRFFGPPGLYRLQFSHPDYEGTPVNGPPQEAEDICTIPNPDPAGPPIQNPALRGNVYRVQNDDQRVLDEPFFTLRVLPSAVTVEVTNDSLDPGPGAVGAPVGGATVTMTRQSTGVVTTLTTDPGTGQASFSLIPGAYTVAVTRVADGTVTYFPVSFTMSLPAGGRAALVEVPLPRIGGAITGEVVAWNSEDNPVAVPAGVQVTDSYDAPDPRVSGPAGATVGVVQNPGPRPPVAAVPAPAPAPAETPSTYRIENVASGLHTLSFNPAGGPAYTAPTPIPVTVLGLVTQPAGRAVYRAADRSVVVTVGVTEASSSPDGALVRLVDPDDPAGGTPVPVGQCAGTGLTRTCSVTFEAVPPELVSYGIQVTKDRYEPADETFTVAPGDPATVIPVRADIAGNVATVNGVAVRQNPGGQSPLPPIGGLLELFRGDEERPIATIAPESNGSYSFDITDRGPYRIRASAPGYAPRTLLILIDRTPGPNWVGDLGSTIPLATLIVPQLATFAITVEPPAARPGSAVGSPVITGAPTIPPAVSSTADGVFNVLVDPGASYRFPISTPAGFLPVTVPATAQRPDVGANVPLTATMAERTVTGSVSPTGSGTVSVRATSEGRTILGTVTGSEFTFTRVPNGTWIVEAARYPGGRGTASTGEVLSTTGNVTGVAVALVARQVAISFATVPPNVTIALAGGASGTATGNNLTLNHPETAFPVTWTATADGYITQTGSIAQPDAPADPYAGALSVTGPSVTLVRPVATATVAPATGADPVVDADVFLCQGDTGACGAATTGATRMTFSDGVYRATPTASGPWRIGASKGVDVATPVAFTVSAAGVISPPVPIALTLVAPTGGAAPGGG